MIIAVMVSFEYSILYLILTCTSTEGHTSDSKHFFRLTARSHAKFEAFNSSLVHEISDLKRSISSRRSLDSLSRWRPAVVIVSWEAPPYLTCVKFEISFWVPITNSHVNGEWHCVLYQWWTAWNSLFSFRWNDVSVRWPYAWAATYNLQSDIILQLVFREMTRFTCSFREFYNIWI